MIQAVTPSRGVFGRSVDAVRRMFAIDGAGGYDAVKDTGRRATPTGILRSEDAELLPLDRRKLISSARDIHRNFAIAAWAVRRHLDYVTTFNFQCRSGNPELDKQVERLMTWWDRPANCDVTGRFSLSRMVRMAEARRVLDGDVFIYKLRNGQLQAIEGDRVRTPIGGIPDPSVNYQDLVHGVEVNQAGKALRYAVCKRNRPSEISNVGTFQFERMVPAKYLYQFGYFDRFDQVRGISPMAPAVNTFADCYKGFDLALAKMRVAQLFGLAIYRDKFDKMGNVLEGVDDAGNKEYSVDFGKGPQFLDLNAGDRAEFLETNSPSPEFQQFSQTMIGVALKALDIPYSFYDESFTTYSGSRQALLQYEASANVRRDEVQQLLDHVTAWRLGLFIHRGLLNAEFSDIRWEWIHKGIGWVDPLNETQANIQNITNGLDTRSRIIKQATGRDFKDVVDEIAMEQQYMIDKKVLLTPAAPVPIVQVTEGAANAAA